MGKGGGKGQKGKRLKADNSDLFELSRNLVTKHARALASKASTWGGRRPTATEFEKLVNACVAEWTRALRQMLKHWDKPPSTTGN